MFYDRWLLNVVSACADAAPVSSSSLLLDHPVVLEEVARKAPPGAQERLLAVLTARMQSFQSDCVCVCSRDRAIHSHDLKI